MTKYKIPPKNYVLPTRCAADDDTETFFLLNFHSIVCTCPPFLRWETA